MTHVNVPAKTFLALTRQANREGIATHRLVARMLDAAVEDTPPVANPTALDDADVDDAGFPLAMTGAAGHRNAA